MEVRVLVVDDDPRVRESTAELLRELGCVVATSAYTGADVLALVRAHDARVVLLDDSPRLDAAPIVDAIEADAALAHVRIVLFSTSLDVEDRAAWLGVAALEKPFSTARLRELLASLAA